MIFNNAKVNFWIKTACWFYRDVWEKRIYTQPIPHHCQQGKGVFTIPYPSAGYAAKTDAQYWYGRVSGHAEADDKGVGQGKSNQALAGKGSAEAWKNTVRNHGTVQGKGAKGAYRADKKDLSRNLQRAWWNARCLKGRRASRCNGVYENLSGNVKCSGTIWAWSLGIWAKTKACRKTVRK